MQPPLFYKLITSVKHHLKPPNNEARYKHSQYADKRT